MIFMRSCRLVNGFLPVKNSGNRQGGNLNLLWEGAFDISVVI